MEHHRTQELAHELACLLPLNSDTIALSLNVLNAWLERRMTDGWARTMLVTRKREQGLVEQFHPSGYVRADGGIHVDVDPATVTPPEIKLAAWAQLEGPVTQADLRRAAVAIADGLLFEESKLLYKLVRVVADATGRVNVTAELTRNALDQTIRDYFREVKPQREIGRITVNQRDQPDLFGTAQSSTEGWCGTIRDASLAEKPIPYYLTGFDLESPLHAMARGPVGVVPQGTVLLLEEVAGHLRHSPMNFAYANGELRVEYYVTMLLNRDATCAVLYVT